MDKLLAIILLVTAGAAQALESPAAWSARYKLFCLEQPKQHYKACMERASAESVIYREQWAAETQRQQREAAAARKR